MNGNVTQDGIRADLAWMHRTGFGGVHFFDAGGILANYAFVQPRLVVGDANWGAAVKLAATTADGLGMEFGTAASSGWSETGGPWVKPEQAMKKLVWSETVVEGGHALEGPLATPPGITGPFQDLRKPGLKASAPGFYGEAKVIAYRIPSTDVPLVPVAATATSGALDPVKLSDGRYADRQVVRAAAPGAAVWIVLDYGRPVTARGLWLGVGGSRADGAGPSATIETSADGVTWRVGATLTGPADAEVKSYGFADLTARYFRVTLPPPPREPELVGMPSRPEDTTRVALSELRLVAGATVDRFAEKAGFSEPIDYAAAATPRVAARTAIAPRDVIDLTSRMHADGTLDWKPPAGRWRILRFGYSLTGQTNAPAPVEATGLEVDKFSIPHTRAYLTEYLRHFEQALGPGLMGRHGLRNLLTDSWEAGVQNWTDDMPAEFQRRRGYDMTPWLPVLTGQVVESAAASDRFLWDFRRTLMDLLAQHYQIIHDEVAKRGMGLYAEAQGDNWRAIADGMEIKSRADIPMAEYWYRTFAAGPGQPTLKADMIESASVAHILGKPLVANESLTVFALQDPWSLSPARLKPVVDEILAYGVNRIVLHTSVHQPSIGKVPGLSLGPFGQFLTRNETWAEQARPFVSYIARSSYLLQQGRNVADVAYFYGEERPIVSLFGGEYDATHDRLKIEVPVGYGFDFINAELLRTATSVVQGTLTTTGGAHYRVLFLRPDVTRMTLPTLHRIATLVDQGVTLVGAPPREALGLGGDPNEFRRMVAHVWGNQPAATGTRRVGAGRVRWGMTLEQALSAEGIAPDVAIGSDTPESEVRYVHRRLDDGSDIYFLANRRDTPAQLRVNFRTVGRTPELWHAETGETEPANFTVDGAGTAVSLPLEGYGAVFVVMRRPSTATSRAAPAPVVRPLARLDDGWSLTFPPNLGAPSGTSPTSLGSWTTNADDGVRHFSGTATYAKTFSVKGEWMTAGRKILLDLGEVHEIASVTLNGQALPISWKPPYRVDVTSMVRGGLNRLEVAVTNLWANRLIGDAAVPAGKGKVTWTARDISAQSFTAGWRKDAPLLPSGLLGPVALVAVDPR